MPNMASKWLAIVFLLWEVLVSNVGPVASYPDFFHDYPKKSIDIGIVL
jgi:hypothetical protein